jgi:hypothetical protein
MPCLNESAVQQIVKDEMLERNAVRVGFVRNPSKIGQRVLCCNSGRYWQTFGLVLLTRVTFSMPSIFLMLSISFLRMMLFCTITVTWPLKIPVATERDALDVHVHIVRDDFGEFIGQSHAVHAGDVQDRLEFLLRGVDPTRHDDAVGVVGL